MSERADVIIVGAGISGLSAALAVHRAGRNVIVLERSDVAGGVIQSSVHHGVLSESGPNSFHSNATLDALIHSLGLDGEKIFAQPAARKRFVLRSGNLCEVPSSPRSLFSSKLLTLKGKARALSELLASRRADNADESLADLVTRRFGREVLDYLVDPLISGIYAGNPARLSSSHVLPILAKMEREHKSVLRGMIAKRGDQSDGQRGVITTFRSGMQMLPAAMASELHSSVRYGSVVTRIVQRDNEWFVSGVGPTGSFAIAAKQVVVALPAHALAHVEFDSSVVQALRPVREVRYASVASVALSFQRSKVAHALDGFGVLIPRVEQRSLLGVLFNSSTFCCRVEEGIVLVTAFLGEAVVEGRTSVAEITDVAIRETSKLLGIRGAPLSAHCTVWPAGIPQYDLGYDAVLRAAERASRDFPGLRLVGSYLNGVSVGDCIANGTAAGNAALGEL